MSRPPGTQTVTVMRSSPGALDRKAIPATVYTPYQWQSCSLQPTDVKEDVTNIDFTFDKFQLFGPASAVGLAVKTTDHIIDANGRTYRVIGIKAPPTLKGIPDHVEVLLEDASGLSP